MKGPLFFVILFCFANLNGQDTLRIDQSEATIKNTYPIPKIFTSNDSVIAIEALHDATNTYLIIIGKNPYKEVKVVKYNLSPRGLPVSIGFIDYNLNGKYDDQGIDYTLYFYGDKDSTDLNYRNKHLQRVVASKRDTLSIDDICYVIDYQSVNDKYIDVIERKDLVKPNLFITSVHQLSLDTASQAILQKALNSNHYLVLDLWFMHCTGCLQGFPKLNKINKQYKGAFHVIGVNGLDSKSSMEAFLKSEKEVLATNIHISRDDLNRLGDESLSFPRYVLIAKNGKILDQDFNLSNLEKLVLRR